MYEIARHLPDGSAERAYYGTDRAKADAVWATVETGVFAQAHGNGVWSAIDRRNTPLAATHNKQRATRNARTRAA
jgi:hypothetical protein